MTKKESSWEKLASMIYESFILKLWYGHCTVTAAIMNKIGPSFKESNIKVVETNPQGKDKKQCLSVIIQNKKNWLKKVVPITYTLEKMFFQLLRLEVCELFLFRQSKKLVLCFGWYESSLLFWRRENHINTAEKKEIIFFFVDI